MTQSPIAPIHRFAGRNVWTMLSERARVSGPDTAFVWHPFVGEGDTWSFSRLHEDAGRVAAGMAERGILQGDLVLVHLENSPEFIISWFACAALGAVAVTTNARSTEAELRYFAEHSGAVAAITSPKFFDRVRAAAPDLRWIAVTEHDAGVPGDGPGGFQGLLESGALLVAAAPDPTAPMSIQYTSGTTSRPKGVLWSHANALWGASVNASQQALRPDDVYLCYLPLFHTNALAYTMLASIWTGSRFILLPKWSTSRFWDVSLKYGCTWLSTGGLVMKAVASAAAPKDHSYRMFATMSCHMPWAEGIGVASLGMWGMTETIVHPVIGDPYSPNRPGSIGRTAPEYEVVVVDADNRPVVDEVGELLVRGTPGVTLFAEYYRNPEATASAFTSDGWFRTGDLAISHPDGYVTFMGRAKDMLKVGGENVAAAEVEAVALGVAGIAEAALVGRPDPGLDEVPVLFVTPRVPGDREHLAEAVMKHCRQELADFKVPRDVRVVGDLPRSNLRKVNKLPLRAAVDSTTEELAVLEAQWMAEAVEIAAAEGE